MADETKNPAAGETAEVQEPESGLEEAEVPAEDESGTVEEQPESDETKVSETEKSTGKEQAKGVDLIRVLEKKLSPEELKAFKDTQAVFTKKSQSLTDVKKQVKAYEDYYKGLAANPEFVALQKSQKEKAKAKEEPDFSKMSEEEIFNYTVDKRVQDKLSELEKKMDNKYGTYIESKQVAEGNKMIADFAESKKIPEENARELAKYAVGHNVSLEDAYKVANFDTIPEQAKQDALEDLDLKKKANLELGSIPSSVAPVIPDKMSFAESAKQAEKETGIKWSKVKT